MLKNPIDQTDADAVKDGALKPILTVVTNSVITPFSLHLAVKVRYQ